MRWSAIRRASVASRASSGDTRRRILLDELDLGLISEQALGEKRYADARAEHRRAAQNRVPALARGVGGKALLMAVVTKMREHEFEQRLHGATYQEIAARGGGIQSTVQHVRQTSKEQLKDLTRRRLHRLLGFG